MSQLQGRIAVVTGGGRGIGRAVARLLAERGAKVVVSGRSAQHLNDTAREIGGLGIECDVARPDSVTAFAARVRKEVGDPDILINNAGIAHSAPFARETLETWQSILATNLTGTFLVTREFVPAMIQRKRGRIVCVASVGGKVGFRYTAAYCASKHGVIGMMRSLAHEIAETGVTVNAVCPGWTESDMAKNAVDNIASKTGMKAADAERTLADMSPQRRLMTAEEVAETICYLCSDAAAGVHGQAWNIDGGSVMS
jgi:NAD(P)-dependent dehydrogenase (short-subunit alcohol dehydrogenase family)